MPLPRSRWIVPHMVIVVKELKIAWASNSLDIVTRVGYFHAQRWIKVCHFPTLLIKDVEVDDPPRTGNRNWWIWQSIVPRETLDSDILHTLLLRYRHGHNRLSVV